MPLQKALQLYEETILNQQHLLSEYDRQFTVQSQTLRQLKSFGIHIEEHYSLMNFFDLVYFLMLEKGYLSDGYTHKLLDPETEISNLSRGRLAVPVRRAVQRDKLGPDQDPHQGQLKRLWGLRKENEALIAFLWADRRGRVGDESFADLVVDSLSVQLSRLSRENKETSKLYRVLKRRLEVATEGRIDSYRSTDFLYLPSWESSRRISRTNSV